MKNHVFDGFLLDLVTHAIYGNALTLEREREKKRERVREKKIALSLESPR
jgi:hypothetical protein